MTDRVSPLCPTTIFHRRLDGMEALNAQLVDLLSQVRAGEPSAADGTTTQGGYQTRDDFLHRDHPALAALRPLIGSAVQDYASLVIRQECTRMPTKVDFVLWGWAVCYQAGDLQGLHVHPAANVSGVYYVTAPPATLGPGDAGKISFYDPRPRANMIQLPFQATRHRYAPMPGDMFLFPSWLEHSVSPFHGDGMRICIAFNAKLLME